MGVRGMLGVITAVAVVSGCSGTASTTSSLPFGTTTTTSTTLVASTMTLPVTTSTTVVDTTTTTTEVVEVLLPANDVEDPLEAIVAIYEYVDYLFARPEVAGEYLGHVYLDSCDCFARLMLEVDRYLENGWVQDDQGSEITNIRISQEFSDAVLLEVTDSYSPQFVIDGSGNRVRLEADEWFNRVSLVGLELGEDGRWRVGAIGVVGEETG